MLRRERLLAVSLGFAFFAIPLYPAFIGLTGAPVPGVSLLPRPLTLTLLVLVAAAGAIWIAMLARAPRRPLPTVPALAALPAAALLAAALGLAPAAGLVFIAILALGVVWHAAILRFFREPGVGGAIAWSYLVSGALASLAAIVMVLTRTPALLYTIGHGRAIGTFVLPGELAGYLIVYVPVAFALARAKAESAALRTVAWAGLGIAAVAFVMTFSRAGWAGMTAALAVMVLIRRRRRNGVRYAVAVIGFSLIVLALVFNAHHDPSENFTRLSIWQAALEVVQRFPFSGVGPFEFARIYPYVRLPGGEAAAFHAHDVLLSIAAETGLIGTIALVAGWWRFVAELRARLAAQPSAAGVAVAIAAGLTGTWAQGLVDTVSIVIFGLWLPMMALALAYAGPATVSVPQRPFAPHARRRGVIAAAAIVVGAACAFVQLGSSAIYTRAAAPFSIAAHLPPHLGTHVYGVLERFAPLPFVEAMLAEDALHDARLDDAERHAAHLPAGALRSDLLARAALARGRTDEAVRDFLAAGDDEALQPFVTQLAWRGRFRDAASLERRIRDGLAEVETRPNALADSCWRLAQLELRLGDVAAARRDYDRAIALAPLNTKYLIDAGILALQGRDGARAATYFARATAVDPRAPLAIRARRAGNR